MRVADSSTPACKSSNKVQSAQKSMSDAFGKLDTVFISSHDTYNIFVSLKNICYIVPCHWDNSVILMSL